jgi:hypothetical protein
MPQAAAHLQHEGRGFIWLAVWLAAVATGAAGPARLCGKVGLRAQNMLSLAPAPAPTPALAPTPASPRGGQRSCAAKVSLSGWRAVGHRFVGHKKTPAKGRNGAQFASFIPGSHRVHDMPNRAARLSLCPLGCCAAAQSPKALRGGPGHSTVTDLAKLRGWSTSLPNVAAA